jgi:GT2 family glycosyltransferase
MNEPPASNSIQPSVLIGIINHNRADELIECVKSIQQCTYRNVAILILDSGSTDDSVKRIGATFPDIVVMHNEKNLGPAGARNIIFGVARKKRPDYLLFLDNDTVVEKGFLEPLVRAMEEEKNAATVGGTILEYENREKIWFGGGKLVPLRGLAVHENKGNEFDRNNPGPARKVSFLTSCLIMFRGTLLDRIGWQDERFFPRFEDIDHAARMKRMGYMQLYVPESVIYHKVAGEKESTFKLYFSVRNRLLLAREGFGGFAGAFASSYFLAVIAVKLLVWKVLRPDFYSAAQAGLVDYFRGNLGEGRGATLFADPRTQGIFKSQSDAEKGIPQRQVGKTRQ